jgi:hypothetical protein
MELMQTQPCKKPKIVNDVIQSFSKAIQERDIKKIQLLLSEHGVYEIQSPRLNTLQVNKKRFVSWIKKRLKQEDQITISYDQCMHCSIGATVLLLNNGSFPRQIKDSSERSKTGLMLEVQDGMISRLKFCFVLVKSENKYVFEMNMRR